MINIKQIQGEQILLRYSDIKAEIEKALEYSSGEWTAHQVVQQAVANPNMFQIWEIQKGNHWVAIAATRVVQYLNFTSLHIMTLGGEGIKDDLIELYLLSKNKVLIGSFTSTYSEVAWWLGGCNEKIVIL